MSFAIFLYVEDLQWTTGDVNGGFNGLGGDEAQVGFDSGNGSHFNLPVSGTPDVLSLDTTSNVNVSGVWVFRIDESSGVTNGSSMYLFAYLSNYVKYLLWPMPCLCSHFLRN